GQGEILGGSAGVVCRRERQVVRVAPSQYRRPAQDAGGVVKTDSGRQESNVVEFRLRNSGGRDCECPRSPHGKRDVIGTGDRGSLVDSECKALAGRLADAIARRKDQVVLAAASRFRRPAQDAGDVVKGDSSRQVFWIAELEIEIEIWGWRTRDFYAK